MLPISADAYQRAASLPLPFPCSMQACKYEHSSHHCRSPTASSSSTNTTHGAFLRASANSSLHAAVWAGQLPSYSTGERRPGRPCLHSASCMLASAVRGTGAACLQTRAGPHLMRAAPRPTNSSTNSEAETAKKGTPASPATARASSVLPVPAGRAWCGCWDTALQQAHCCRRNGSLFETCGHSGFMYARHAGSHSSSMPRRALPTQHSVAAATHQVAPTTARPTASWRPAAQTCCCSSGTPHTAKFIGGEGSQVWQAWQHKDADGGWNSAHCTWCFRHTRSAHSSPHGPSQRQAPLPSSCPSRAAHLGQLPLGALHARHVSKRGIGRAHV